MGELGVGLASGLPCSASNPHFLVRAPSRWAYYCTSGLQLPVGQRRIGPDGLQGSLPALRNILWKAIFAMYLSSRASPIGKAIKHNQIY